MLALVTIMVKDFCNSVNVVRNMTEDQMIECAAMLLDECGNFRMEDYLMMFNMAKRGQLVKIFDRLDITVVTQMLDEYWAIRHKAGEEALAAQDVPNTENRNDRIEMRYHEGDPNDKSIPAEYRGKSGYVPVRNESEMLIGASSAISKIRDIINKNQ
jgi:hypothetical protein